jgi:glycosyltransferase involved in cell wall biosynthesis
MRVLQFGKFYPPDVGGIERIIFDITEGLNARGIPCDVLCSNCSRTYAEQTIKTYRVMRTASYGVLFSASITPGIVSKLKQVQSAYDIIHVHLPDPMANLALYVARPKAKLVLHWHNDVVRQRLLLKFYEPLQEWMLRRADAIIATSPNYIKGSDPLTRYEAKCRVVPNGVDRARLPAAPAKVGEIKRRFAGKRIVLGVGRLTGYKGFEYLVEAAKFLSDRYVVLIAGTGPTRRALSRQVTEAALGEKVFLLGRVPDDDLGSYYEACDVFCLSSVARNEGFGLVQIEAMLFGKPVVSTNVEGSGMPWVNVDGQTGLVVQPADAAALAGAVERICASPELYGSMSANALRRAREQFSTSRMVDRTIEVYAQVLGAGGAALLR